MLFSSMHFFGIKAFCDNLLEKGSHFPCSAQLGVECPSALPWLDRQKLPSCTGIRRDHVFFQAGGAYNVRGRRAICFNSICSFATREGFVLLAETHVLSFSNFFRHPPKIWLPISGKFLCIPLFSFMRTF